MGKNGICYFPPANGSWNLAHICRLLPESHALFVVPAGCGRVVQLSAVAAGLHGRISLLRVTEQDLIAGGLEEKTLEAARMVIHRVHPKALFLFSSCASDFIGLDREAIFGPLQKEFPDIPMLDGRMDPINRETGLPPIVRMNNALYSVLQREPAEKPFVLCSGSFWPPEEGQELLTHLEAHGIGWRHLYRCETFAEAKALGGASLNLVFHAVAVPAAKALKARLGIPWVPLFPCQDLPSLEKTYGTICAQLHIEPPDLTAETAAVRQAAETLKTTLCGRFVDLDDGYCPNPAGLARQLLTLGVPVRRVYLDGGGKEIPGVEVIDSGAPEFAVNRSVYRDPEAVCAGETAAFADQSEHFCSGLGFSGRMGLSGLRRTLEDLTEAASTSRPLTSVPHSGKGCFGR